MRRGYTDRTGIYWENRSPFSGLHRGGAGGAPPWVMGDFHSNPWTADGGASTVEMILGISVPLAAVALAYTLWRGMT